jgi:drug/metabolite transporter (DMT)-like permease
MLAATTDPGRLKRRGQMATATVAVAWSTAGVLQRELSMGAATQVAGRALFALIALLAYVAVVERGAVVASFRSIGRAGLAVAVCMASASGLFIIALNHASVAHVLFMQAAAPILAALLGSVVLSEPIPLRTWLAMVVAASGVLVMVGQPSGWSLLGDGVSVVMTLSFAIAIVITRRHRHVSMAPATCLAQLLLVLVFASFAHPGEVGGRDLGLLILLGGVQMGIGLALFTIGARLIPAAEVALITLLEVVLGPLWVWLFLSEDPGAATLVGGAVVVVAVAVQVAGEMGGRVVATQQPPPP